VGCGQIEGAHRHPGDPFDVLDGLCKSYCVCCMIGISRTE
jgi:hypothetical protein